MLTAGQLREVAAQLGSGERGVVRTRDGRHLEWRRAPLGHAVGQPGYVLSIHDITARIQLDELRDDMIAMLVHDLRTPLSAMMLSIDMLDYDVDGETRAEMMARARHSARQMLGKVNTLLDLRKIEAGQLKVVREPYAIAGVVAGVVDGLQGVAELGGVRLGHSVSLDLPDLSIDADLITRVIENLIGNALKFTPSGGAICVEAEEEEAGVVVRVADTGIGVPAGMRERIFEKYVQVHGSQERRGSGLGLAFCSLVVAAHGGQIGVRENPGGGSVFWLRLPLG